MPVFDPDNPPVQRPAYTAQFQIAELRKRLLETVDLLDVVHGLVNDLNNEVSFLGDELQDTRRRFERSIG